METKEENLAYIKGETGWSDEKCLEWFNQQEEADRSANEVADIWYAYEDFDPEKDKPKFVVTKTAPSEAEIEEFENFQCTSSEKRARELIKEWEEPYKRELEWDKYINRK